MLSVVAADKECKDHDYCPFCQLYCASPCKWSFARAAKCTEAVPKHLRTDVCEQLWSAMLECEIENMDYFKKVAEEMVKDGAGSDGEAAK